MAQAAAGAVTVDARAILDARRPDRATAALHNGRECCFGDVIAEPAKARPDTHATAYERIIILILSKFVKANRRGVSLSMSEPRGFPGLILRKRNTSGTAAKGSPSASKNAQSM